MLSPPPCTQTKTGRPRPLSRLANFGTVTLTCKHSNSSIFSVSPWPSSQGKVTSPANVRSNARAPRFCGHDGPNLVASNTPSLPTLSESTGIESLNRAGMEAYLRFRNWTEVVDDLPRKAQPSVGCLKMCSDGFIAERTRVGLIVKETDVHDKREVT